MQIKLKYINNNLQKINKLFEDGTISEINSHENLENESSKIVWKKIYQKRKKLLLDYKRILPKIYYKSIIDMGYNEYSIPTLTSINDYVSKTKWKVVWSKKLSIFEFCLLAANNIFPISTSYRSLDEIDFALYPDFIHDLWGHIPLLQWDALSELIIFLSKEFISYEDTEIDKDIYEEIFAENIEYNNDDNEEIIDIYEFHPKKLISRIFLLTIEFGLLKTEKNYEIYGGGILSSSSEIDNVFMEKNKKYHFDYLSICRKKFSYFDLQNKYFYVNNFDEIYELLDKIKKGYIATIKEKKHFLTP